MLTNQSSLRFRGMELLIAYSQTSSVEIRNQIVQMNIGLVRKIAHRVSRQCTEPYEDLEQVGCLGLIRAIERFNPSQGCAFSSFAVPYIRGEMLHYLRDKSGVVRIPRRWQDLKKDGQKAREDLSQSLGRLPSDAEVAQKLNISVQEWTEAKMSDQNRQLLSLDAKIGQQTDNVVTLGETLPDSHYQVLQELDEERQQLQNALGQLEETTRVAIEFVMVSGLSRKEVAEKIGVSPMTVSRRIQRGVEQMIAFIQPQSLQTEP